MGNMFPLETFDLAKVGSRVVDRAETEGALSDEALEAHRLMAYEDGYKSGWDDAIQASGDDHDRISAEFARNLRDLGFTFHEARAHVISAIEPLLGELLDEFLPSVLPETVASALLAELTSAAEHYADTPVRIVVAPAEAAVLRQIIPADATMPCEIEEEAAMAEGQAYFMLGKSETRINLSGALDRVRTALGALSAANERTLQHG